MTTKEELEQKLRFHQNAGGAVPSPFDCWLLLRGINTLALRVDRQSQNATEVAQVLEKNKAVRRVYYPGLASHPNHAVASRQIRMLGGIITPASPPDPTALPPPNP